MKSRDGLQLLAAKTPTVKSGDDDDENDDDYEDEDNGDVNMEEDYDDAAMTMKFVPTKGDL